MAHHVLLNSIKILRTSHPLGGWFAVEFSQCMLKILLEFLPLFDSLKYVGFMEQPGGN